MADGQMWWTESELQLWEEIKVRGKCVYELKTLFDAHNAVISPAPPLHRVNNSTDSWLVVMARKVAFN